MRPATSRHEDLKSLHAGVAAIMGAAARPYPGGPSQRPPPMSSTTSAERTDKFVKSDAEWRAQLTPEQYYVLRQHGTERAGTSPLNREKRKGLFLCAGCGAPLFSSDAKFDSGTGWPSFDRPAADAAVSEHDDRALFMHRTEVRCARCEGHLGHVFPDGPRDTTGLRYCINGLALKFKPE
jgi:peptide-methionine (R)-S-oxide reductase